MSGTHGGRQRNIAGNIIGVLLCALALVGSAYIIYNLFAWILKGGGW